MSIRLSAIRIPKEMVFFYSPSLQRALLLNPELGSYTTIPYQALESLRELAAGRFQGHIPEKVLHSLIVHRVIYYGNFQPSINDKVPSVPAALYWETTHGCSLRCDYCYMSADTVLPDELTTVEAKRLIDQCAEVGIRRFVFTGGEPLIRRDIFELGAYAKERGLSTEIITNATLITSAQTARSVRDNFDAIITSLDGASPAANDVHRGFGSFTKIVRGIQLLNDVGVVPTLNCTVSELNVAYVGELLEFIKESLQAEHVRLINVSFIGRGSQKKIDYTWETYRQTFEQIREHNARHVEHVAPSPSKSSFKPRKNCGMGSGEIYVNSVGDVFPCKLVTLQFWYSGNVKRQTLNEILQAEALQRARDLSVENRLGCRSCIIRRLCGGGCRGIHMGYTGDPLVNSPEFCWVLRHQMITNLWSSEGYPNALSDAESVVPISLRTGQVWQPELGTALPDRALSVITRHLSALHDNELPLA